MGGRSSQASETKNQTSTSTVNESLNTAISGDLEEGALAVSGKNVTVTTVDAGVFDFATATLDGVGGIITQLLENQQQTYSAANDLAGVAVSNIAAASGVEPVIMGQKALTQMQKVYIGVGGFASVAALSYALMNR